MPAYIVADTKITDPERYEEYKRFYDAISLAKQKP